MSSSNSWAQLSLGELFEIERGGSPRPIQDYFTENADGINWVLIGDTTEGSKYITSTKKKIRKEGAKRSRLIQPGDFVLSNSMSFGRPYISQIHGCIHDGWLLLRPKSGKINQDYLYRVLNSDLIYTEFSKRAAGATVKNLNIDLVKDVSIPLPPLPEQRRIAAILDSSDTIRQKRKAAIAKLDELAQSVFLEMFGDPVKNEKKLRQDNIGSLCNTSSGGTPSRTEHQYWKNGSIPWVKSGEVAQGDIWDTEEKITSLGAERSSTKLFPVNTVLVAMYGATVGQVGILKIPATTNQAICGILPNTKLLPYFLYVQIKMLKSQLLKLAEGGAQPNISQEKIRNLKILVPDMSLQLAYMNRLSAIGNIKRHTQSSLKFEDSLFSSLQHRAFTGEL